MMISDLAHAAQAVAPGEEPRFYDDRGCLAKDSASLPAGAKLYVQLEGGKGWVDVHDAFFAYPDGLRTPMGYGVTAFLTAEGASKADRQRRALRWDEVVRQVRADAP